MANSVTDQPNISRLESLPDELLLGILSTLPFESFYCISQSSRRLRNLCEDRVFQVFQDRKRNLVRSEMNRYDWQVQLRREHQPHPAGFCHDITSKIARELPDPCYLAPLLRKKLLCEECQEFWSRCQSSYNGRRLLAKKRCRGCMKYHGAMLFPKHPDTGALGPVCLAHLGYVRLCPHKFLRWRDMVRIHARCLENPQWTFSRRCQACEESTSTFSSSACVTHDTRRATLLYERRLPGLLDARNGSAIGGDYLDTVREFCRAAEYQYICPHLRLDNLDLVQQLIRAIPGFWSIHTQPVPEGTETDTDEARPAFKGHVFQCGSCNCRMQLSLVREGGPSPDIPDSVYLTFSAWQRVVVTKFPRAKFLTKLDPASYGYVDVRSPLSRCISWCDTPDCTTSRLRRREAKVLEAAW
ncbi:hypothetical protein PG985_013241 [Apiospora marii]|uniref:F-box domain-containing protein n=1 Tax=Apiospora marii TaxID=335849 RepID=A0ABR1R8E8_9PEZI